MSDRCATQRDTLHRDKKENNADTVMQARLRSQTHKHTLMHTCRFVSQGQGADYAARTHTPA